MIDLHFIRHLPPHPDAYAYAYGIGDVPLVSDHSLVKERLQYLGNDLPSKAQWHVSPSPRTRLTADLILAANPKLKTATLAEDEAFLEQKFGVFADRLHSELRKDPDFVRYVADPHNVSPEGGESITQAHARVATRLDQFMHEDGKHVVVAHGGTLSGALAWGHALADSAMQERMKMYMGGSQLGKQRLTPLTHIFMRVANDDHWTRVVSFAVTGGPEFRTHDSLVEVAPAPRSLTP